MKSFVIQFEDQRHYVDYSSEMVEDAHIVSIFLHDQKLVNIAGDHFHLLKRAGSGNEDYAFEPALSSRGGELKQIIALEVKKIFRKAT